MLFIEKFEVVQYGGIQKIENYFLSENIFTNLSESEISDSGWDYLVTKDVIYLLIDIDYKEINYKTRGFLIFNEKITGLIELVAYLKEHIRSNKLEDLFVDQDF